MNNIEFDLNKYKEKVIRKRIKKRVITELIVFIFLLLLNILLLNINIWFILLLMIFNLIFILVCINTFNLIKCSNVTIGEIIDVTLKNFDDAPYILAKIKYYIKEKELFEELEICQWGDNNGDDGEEEAIKKWFVEEKKLYLNKKIPVLYNDKHIDKVMVYFNDIIE